MQIIDCSKDSHLECVKANTEKGDILPFQIAAEHRMAVYINERLAMRLTCTPQHLDELVLGRLLTEGLILRAEDVQQIYICEKGLASIALGAKALALTALDLIEDPILLEKIRQDHQKAWMQQENNSNTICLLT